MITMADTIAAIATARGVAALAIIRVSGSASVQVVDGIFRGPDLTKAASHTAHVGYIMDYDGRPIDQVVVTLFLSPRSVTGEDVVEISCHGGDFASQLILQRLIEQGIRLAAPGEFTQRSFLNGKVDLAQAEAVADLIHASSTMAHRVSVQHIQGRYSDQLQQLRSELVELCAFIELELDFVEEDVEFADHARLVGLLDNIARLLEELRASYRLGATIRDGVGVVIAGRPNAGKSTLLNALVGHNRAIVSDIPGTTRDEIEAEVEIDGIRFRFRDTAGLRESADVIEAEGVRRAERAAGDADVLIYVFDAMIGLDAAERAFLHQLQQERATQEVALPLLVIENKSDLAEKAQRTTADTFDPVLLSARNALSDSEALKPVLHRLRVVVTDHLHQADASLVVMNQRHQQHLRSALHAVEKARAAISGNASGDMLATDLRVALHELGHITGEITNEDVLDQIFSRFCIGK